MAQTAIPKKMVRASVMQKWSNSRPDSKPRRGRARLRAKLLLLAGGLLFSGLVIEIGLRLAGYHHPVVTQPDSNRGYGYVPGSKWINSSEGHATVEINQRGFRGSLPPLQKPDNVFRIVVLGDSFTDATQLAESGRFTEILQQRLDHVLAKNGRRMEVLNFGVSGYGTAQQLMTLRHEASAFQPDVVLLAFFPGNDVRNNLESLEQDPGRPYFLLQDGSLQLDDSFRHNRVRTSKRVGLVLARYSRLGQAAYRQYQSLRRRRQANNRAPAAVDSEELGIDTPVFAPPTGGEWEEAWRVTEYVIDLMQQEVHDHGAELFVVSLTCGIQVHPDSARRENFAAALNVDNLLYPGRRLGDFCDKKEIAFLDLAPILQKRANEEQVYLHGFENTALGTGHWNATGHQLAAETMADFMLTSFLGASKLTDGSRNVGTENH